MKSINQTSGKGFLEIDFDEGKSTLTVVDKNGETTYDFYEVLERFNRKEISFSIKEENPVAPIED